MLGKWWRRTVGGANPWIIIYFYQIIIYTFEQPCISTLTLGVYYIEKTGKCFKSDDYCLPVLRETGPHKPRTEQRKNKAILPFLWLSWGVELHGTEDVLPGFRELQKQKNPQKIPYPTARLSHLNMRKGNTPPTFTHGDGDFLKMIQSVSSNQGLKSKPRSLSNIYVYYIYDISASKSMQSSCATWMRLYFRPVKLHWKVGEST